MALTYNGASATSSIYVNGQLAGACRNITAKPSDMAVATDLFIGRPHDSRLPYLNAQLGCFRVLDRALRYVRGCTIMHAECSHAHRRGACIYLTCTCWLV